MYSLAFIVVQTGERGAGELVGNASLCSLIAVFVESSAGAGETSGLVPKSGMTFCPSEIEIRQCGPELTTSKAGKREDARGTMWLPIEIF